MFEIKWEEGKDCQGERIERGILGKWTIFVLRRKLIWYLLECELPGMRFPTNCMNEETARNHAQKILDVWIESAQ